MDSIERERDVALGRLWELKRSEAFLNDDPAAVKEAGVLRAKVRELEIAGLTPMERAKRAIDERSAPTPEELQG